MIISSSAYFGNEMIFFLIHPFLLRSFAQCALTQTESRKGRNETKRCADGVFHETARVCKHNPARVK